MLLVYEYIGFKSPVVLPYVDMWRDADVFKERSPTRILWR